MDTAPSVVAAERLPEWMAVHPHSVSSRMCKPAVTGREDVDGWSGVSSCCGSSCVLGRRQRRRLPNRWAVAPSVDEALLTLESEGVVFARLFTG